MMVQFEYEDLLHVGELLTFKYELLQSTEFLLLLWFTRSWGMRQR